MTTNVVPVLFALKENGGRIRLSQDAVVVKMMQVERKCVDEYWLEK
jgi:hypothetical protein